MENAIYNAFNSRKTQKSTFNDLISYETDEDFFNQWFYSDDESDRIIIQEPSDNSETVKDYLFAWAERHPGYSVVCENDYGSYLARINKAMNAGAGCELIEYYKEQLPSLFWVETLFKNYEATINEVFGSNCWEAVTSVFMKKTDYYDELINMTEAFLLLTLKYVHFNTRITAVADEKR